MGRFRLRFETDLYRPVIASESTITRRLQRVLVQGFVDALFAFTSNPFGVVAIQLLDGVAAGIFGVISIVIAADIMKGTGRFNVAQGLVAVAVGVGASLSSVTSGYVVTWFGFPSGFLYLAVVAFAALALFALLMPETRDSQSPVPRSSGTDSDGNDPYAIDAAPTT